MTTLKNTYELKQHGKVIFTGTYNECWIKLLKSQPQSTHYAMKYGGWTITKARAESVK